MEKTIAISVKDSKLYGCPYCGYSAMKLKCSHGGTSLGVCGQCEKDFVTLIYGLQKSKINCGDYYPELQNHPREGISKHDFLN